MSDDEVLAAQLDFISQKSSGFNQDLMAVYVGETCDEDTELCGMGANR
jgi:hypothetical protein